MYNPARSCLVADLRNAYRNYSRQSCASWLGRQTRAHKEGFMSVAGTADIASRAALDTLLIYGLKGVVRVFGC